MVININFGVIERLIYWIMNFFLYICEFYKIM